MRSSSRHCRRGNLPSLLGDCVIASALRHERILGAILPLHDFRYHACLRPYSLPAVAEAISLRTSLLARGFAARAPGWWSQTGSNRRPPACKAGALPTELWPRQVSVIRDQQSDASSDFWSLTTVTWQWWARVDLNYRPHAYQACALTT